MKKEKYKKKRERETASRIQTASLREEKSETTEIRPEKKKNRNNLEDGRMISSLVYTISEINEIYPILL